MDWIFRIGWPFTYLEFTQPAFGAPGLASTFIFSSLLLNFVLVTLTLLGIVFSIQTMMPKPQFSVSTLLVAVSFAALVVGFGNLTFSSENSSALSNFMNFRYNATWPQTVFVMSIYFAPLIAVIPVFIYSQTKSVAKNA